MGGEGKMGSRQPSRINGKRIRVNRSKWEEEQNLRFGAAFRETCLRQGVSEEALRRFMASPDAEMLETMSVLVGLQGRVKTEESGDGLPSLEQLDAALLPTSESSETGVVLVPEGYRLVLAAKRQGLKEASPWSNDGSWDYMDQLAREYVSVEESAHKYLRWRPYREVSLLQVVQYFSERGFGGDAAAFLALAAQDQTDGVVVGLPKMGCWKRPDKASLLVLISCAKDSVRTFGLSRINQRNEEKFPADYSFVGFRRV
jgi:hypothetical protein